MRHYNSKGFTIVELLIVIVVIGILAAITIVAFNGIQNRARVAIVTTDLSSATRQIALYEVDAGAYPTTLSQLNNGQGLKASKDTSFQYSGGGTAYCLTATNSNVSYNTSNTASTPAQGGCAGHGVGGVAAITNLMPNPSFENTFTGWNNAMKSGDTAIISTVQKHSGSYSVALTAASNTIDSYIDDQITLQPGTYTVSGFVYLTSNGATYGNRDAMFYDAGGLSGTPGTIIYNRSLLNQWQHVSGSFTTSTPGSLGVRFYVPNGTSYVDGVMLTSGSTLANYADGSSPNWIWNGTPNNSSSTGPPL
jgi:prepilin-type N-terminal cleavage/methylation domain-containing protein